VTSMMRSPQTEVTKIHRSLLHQPVKLQAGRGHFNHQSLNAFVSTIEIYPLSTLIKLSSNQLGVITDQGTQN